MCTQAFFIGCRFFVRCGYTVSKVSNGKAEFVHETSVKHYKDSLTFTFTEKVWIQYGCTVQN